MEQDLIFKIIGAIAAIAATIFSIIKIIEYFKKDKNDSETDKGKKVIQKNTKKLKVDQSGEGNKYIESEGGEDIEIKQ
jgi:hypothetical protein